MSENVDSVMSYVHIQAYVFFKKCLLTSVLVLLCIFARVCVYVWCVCGVSFFSFKLGKTVKFHGLSDKIVKAISLLSGPVEYNL